MVYRQSIKHEIAEDTCGASSSYGGEASLGVGRKKLIIKPSSSDVTLRKCDKDRNNNEDGDDDDDKANVKFVGGKKLIIQPPAAEAGRKKCDSDIDCSKPVIAVDKGVTVDSEECYSSDKATLNDDNVDSGPVVIDDVCDDETSQLSASSSTVQKGCKIGKKSTAAATGTKKGKHELYSVLTVFA